jgi:hypothetical protein
VKRPSAQLVQVTQFVQILYCRRKPSEEMSSAQESRLLVEVDGLFPGVIRHTIAILQLESDLVGIAHLSTLF